MGTLYAKQKVLQFVSLSALSSALKIEAKLFVFSVGILLLPTPHFHSFAGVAKRHDDSVINLSLPSACWVPGAQD
jgi:hypothetical protein